MYPIKFSYTPADDSTTGYATGLTGAGPFTPSTTTAGDGLAHLTSLTSASDIHTLTITITGTDAEGNSQTEDITAPTSNTVYGTKYFRTITSVASSATLGANTMDVGWKDECVGPTFPLNWRQKTFQVSLGVDISGTINYTVQHTFNQMGSANPSTFTWWPHATLVTKTADADGNYASPVTATRLLINSLTSGATAAFYVVQGR